MKRCPKCESTRRTRRSRKSFLKFVPLSKLYACLDCGTKYLYLQLIDMSVKIKAKVYRRLA